MRNAYDMNPQEPVIDDPDMPAQSPIDDVDDPATPDAPDSFTESGDDQDRALLTGMFVTLTRHPNDSRQYVTIACSTVAGRGPGTTSFSRADFQTLGQDDPSAATASTDGDFLFASPSGNVSCRMYRFGVECRAAVHDWHYESPGCSDLAGAAVFDNGVASSTCISDALSGGSPLPYVTSHVVGDFRCSSTRSGVTCDNTTTKHGFNISRATLTLYGVPSVEGSGAHGRV